MLQSQGQIKANFQAINSAFAQNHSALNQPTQGMHDLLLFRSQTSDPVTSATQIALYTKLVSTFPCLFFMPNSTQTPIQLTYPSIKVDSTNTQYSFVAGPFVIYGGVINAAVQNQLVILTPFTTLKYVGLVAQTLNQNPVFFQYVCATNIIGNSFNIQFSSASAPLNVSYLAIGQ